ncbi:MAG: hypothetical protein VR64_09280 [Desulfatitalea sp. BRH_c12]|nr:MAG: hypothetical protein VR64_09280 [Desulfatitalea sp. BRH_c12]
MMMYDDIFAWEGFGGVYQLAAGKCRLRILDLSKGDHRKVAHLKPIMVVVSDLPVATPQFRNISVRSCASHIATTVAARFQIDPLRMTYVEYYPASTYGDRDQFVIEAKYDAVDFTWFEDKALHPKWRPLPPALRDVVQEMVAQDRIVS